MIILASARKHGVEDEDILHAWRHMMRYGIWEYDGESRLFVVGPYRHGFLLELVAVPADDPDRIIHADRLRPSRDDLL
jgi:hypothetical protein